MMSVKTCATVLSLVSFVCVNGYCQESPEFSKIASAMRRDKQDSPLNVVVDRLPFNEFLGNIPRPWVVQARLTSEQVSELRKMTENRSAALKKNVDEAQKIWVNLASDKRSVELTKILKADEKLVQEMVTRLDEFLSPNQRETLASAYMRIQGEFSCTDPILRNWLGLTEEEANRIHTRYGISSHFIVSKLKERKLSPLSRLPADEEAEFFRLQILSWEGIDGDKIKRIFVHAGILHENEDLAAYVERFPEAGDLMVKYLPVFAESVKKKKEGKPE